MEDKDSLYFSFDDENKEDAGSGDVEEAQAEEGQNRTFLIGAIALAAVFLLGICAVVAFILLRPGANTPAAPSANQLTNEFNMTQAAFTQTAVAQAQSLPTDVPATTAAPKASATPTSGGIGVVVTTPTVGATTGTAGGVTGTPGTPGTPGGIVEVTAIGGGLGGQAGVTPTGSGLGGAAKSPTPGGPTATKGSSGIIEVTALGGAGGGSGIVTPTQIAGSAGGSLGGNPTGVGGPAQPTAIGSLPHTGFSGGLGLAGAGLMAVVLIVVVVVARRMRLQ